MKGPETPVGQCKKVYLCCVVSRVQCWLEWADGDQQRGISRSLEIHLAAQVAAARTSHHHNKYCHHQLSKLSVRKKYCSCKLKCMVI